MTIFITGAAGYIGGLLTERFARREDVDEVICLDRKPITEGLKALPKVLFIRANTADDTWQEVCRERAPDVVIHCAWQIREFYFRKKLQERWNLGGSRNVFEFASGRHLIHFSSVAVYGAYPDNRVDRPFTEKDPMRENEYRYGVEKRRSEEMLLSSRAESKDPEGIDTDITILRIATITGPRYKTAKRGFTLQNILALLPVIPIANPEWGRQFVQEDELVNVVERLCHSELVEESRETRNQRDPSATARDDIGYRTLNIAPSPFIKAADIARKYGKAILPIPKELVRIAFFILRHLSLGRLPASRGGWRQYVYPLAVDGGAVMRAYNSRKSFILYTQ